MILNYNIFKGKYIGIEGNSQGSADDFIFRFEDIDTIEFAHFIQEGNVIPITPEDNLEQPCVFHVGQDTGSTNGGSILQINDETIILNISITHIGKITLKDGRVIELCASQINERYSISYLKLDDKKLIIQDGIPNSIWEEQFPYFCVIDSNLNFYHFNWDKNNELCYIKTNLITNEEESHGLGLYFEK